MEIEGFQSYRPFSQSDVSNETQQSANNESETYQFDQNKNELGCYNSANYFIQGQKQLDFYLNMEGHQKDYFQNKNCLENQIYDMNYNQPDTCQTQSQISDQPANQKDLEFSCDIISNKSEQNITYNYLQPQELQCCNETDQEIYRDIKTNKKENVFGQEIIDKYQNSFFSNPLLEFYFISGNICVMNCALNKEFTHFSNLNSCKIPIRTKACSTLGTLEVDLNNKRGGIQNFEFIIQKMRSVSSQRVYKCSLMLEKYQKFVNSYLQRQELLKYQQVTNQFLTKIDSKFDQFVLKTQKIIQEIAQNHPFFSYTLNQFNLQNFEMEMRKFGYSEAFLALLGVDMKQAQSLIWRKGLFDYMDRKNIQEMLFQYISHLVGDNIIQPHDITLFTFDGYEVYAVNNIRVFIDRDAENPFIGMNQALFVNVYDISPNMIKQIISIRQKNKELSQEKIKQQEEDLSYSMEANIFLEKYYKDQQEDFLLQNKRAGYKLIK
ncbi:hypothetical protein TTHERM_00248410 (macronuclear) [Tetrahymena thermophila SB210]|uniref:Uncharacterized protein n=1 Tax=Tetrahymena thermophila (strain SB210) TaxID=312017 RepID=Q245K7_TETTS|nr:hypothetical protein TTHERM_00248410 [Tetrahymena thermophila SB210]EAS03625.1 hypothetical protein TTHERM_00248410 [Tetrahymena thermophila SB210]|eukprot:XP_001023871.1 hypothetical protein TTHERM_00248410 [Tetrahymena thermophila SB210]